MVSVAQALVQAGTGYCQFSRYSPSPVALWVQRHQLDAQCLHLLHGRLQVCVLAEVPVQHSCHLVLEGCEGGL